MVRWSEGGGRIALLSKTAVEAMADRRVGLVCRNGSSGVGRARIDKISSVAWTRESASEVVGKGVLWGKNSTVSDTLSRKVVGIYTLTHR